MWQIMAFSALIFMVQAGVSLHQAPYYLQKGFGPAAAASIVSVFALSSALGGLVWSLAVRLMRVRFVIASSAGSMLIGVLLILRAAVLMVFALPPRVAESKEVG